MISFNRKILALAISTSLIFISACAPLSKPYEYQQISDSQFATVQGMRAKKATHKNVSAMKKIYVEQLSESDANRPSWYFDKAEAHFDRTPFSDVLSSTFYGLPINFKYEDNLKTDKPLSVNFDGNYGQVLDAIANAVGYSYTVDGQVVTWSKFKMASIDISMFPGEESFGIGKTGSEQGSESSSIEKMTSTAISSADEFAHNEGKLNVIDDIAKALMLMKSEEGSVHINESTMTAVVHDYPANVKKMEDYIAEKNDQLTRMCALDMEIIDVELNDQSGAGLDWNAVGKQLAGRGIDVGLSGTMGSSMATDSAPSILTLSRTTGQWTGTDALVRALKAQGAVSTKMLPRATTLNNRAVKLRDIQQNNFILERTITTTANVGTSGSIKQGTVESGFSLYALPKINKQDIILRLTTNLSTLLGIDTKGTDAGVTDSTGSSTSTYVEAPRVNSKDFDNSIVVRSGETLILAGYSSDHAENERNEAGNWIFGFGKTASRKRIETIITITPTILRGERG